MGIRINQNLEISSSHNLSYLYVLAYKISWKVTTDDKMFVGKEKNGCKNTKTLLSGKNVER